MPVSSVQKWDFESPPKNEHHFFHVNIPQNGGIGICFVHLSLLGRFKPKFTFWGCFPFSNEPKLKVRGYQGMQVILIFSNF